MNPAHEPAPSNFSNPNAAKNMALNKLKIHIFNVTNVCATLRRLTLFTVQKTILKGVSYQKPLSHPLYAIRLLSCY